MIAKSAKVAVRLGPQYIGVAEMASAGKENRWTSVLGDSPTRRLPDLTKGRR